MPNDQSLTLVANEGQEIGFLLIAERAEAARQHENGIVVAERPRVHAAAFVPALSGNLSLRDQLRIGADHRHIGAGLATDLFDCRKRV